MPSNTIKNYRDHTPIPIPDFGGLFDQNDPHSCPLDHFTDGENFTFKGKGVKTRDGIGISQDVALPLSNVKRLYNYPTATGNTIIALTYNAVTGVGSIYHVVTDALTYGPLLSLTGMRDFAFVPFGGRGYISPIGYYTITSVTEGTLNIEKGLQSEFLYVYDGAGTAARKAAGTPLSGALTIANGAAGFTTPGFHLFGVVAETSSGALLAPGALTGFNTVAASSVSFGTIPVGGATVTKRHIVATKAIVGFNGNKEDYDYFFIPGATINDNTTLFLNNVSFYDADLLDDASHLFDNFAEIPAGASLCLYHERLCLAATYADPNAILVSAVSEPEAISEINGLITVPLDGNPITNIQELRDILYVFKRSWSTSYADNGDEPATWPPVLVDTALGTCVHGIGTVLNTGGTSVDYLLVCTYQGLSTFNGRYVEPELTWKIWGLWGRFDRDEFRKIQIVNSPIRKEILIVMPDNSVLVGNYMLGMDPKNIRWCRWTYTVQVNTICIASINEIVLGADLS